MIMSLKVDSGMLILREEQLIDEDNLLPVFLESYGEFLTVFSSNDERQFTAFANKQQFRIRGLSAGSKEDPYTLFSQGECHLHLALLYLRFQDPIGAIKNIKRSYKLHQKNLTKFPDFKPSQKTRGMITAILGSIPEQYQWGLSLFGLSGDTKLGLEMIRESLDDTDSQYPFKRETELSLAMLEFHLNNNADSAWIYLREHAYPNAANLLDYYIIAYVGVFGGAASEVLELLDDRPYGNEYLQFPHLNYLEGLAKLYLGDPGAITSFETFIEETKGENYVAASWQKIAWSYIQQGDTEAYFEIMKLIKELDSPKIDVDKQARREAKSMEAPNPILLRARMLYDAGLYEDALIELGKFDIDFSTFKEFNEFTYRLGRVQQALGNEAEALQAYLRAVESGWGSKQYYPYNACLQLGYIYEAQGYEDIANEYFNKVLDSPDHEYKFSLDQKAKAALKD